MLSMRAIGAIRAFYRVAMRRLEQPTAGWKDVWKGQDEHLGLPRQRLELRARELGPRELMPDFPMPTQGPNFFAAFRANDAYTQTGRMHHVRSSLSSLST